MSIDMSKVPPPPTDRVFVATRRSDVLMAAAAAFYNNEQKALAGSLHPKLEKEALQEAKKWLPLYYAEIAKRFGPPDCICPYPPDYAKPNTATIYSSLCKKHGPDTRPDLWPDVQRRQRRQ